MDPKVCGKLLTTHRRGKDVDVEALRGWFPFRKSASEGSKMDLADTKGYGGGNCVSWCSWMFSGYVGIYRKKKYVGGHPRGPQDREAHLTGRARPPISWGSRELLDLHSKFFRSDLFQKSRSRRFHSVWTPFDIPFLWNTEIGKKTAIWAGPPVSRLVPKMI